MELYRLTRIGEKLVHSYRSPQTPPWGVIHFLNKRSIATKEQILANVPGATSLTLAKLKRKRIIAEGTGVDIEE